MHIELQTVLGCMLAIPCIIALAKGKDGQTKTLLAVTAVVGGILAAWPFVDAVRDLMNGNLMRAFAAAAAVLGILVAIRLSENKVIGTLTTTAGLLLAGWAFGIIGH